MGVKGFLRLAVLTGTMRWVLLWLTVLAGCDRTAWNTTVADSAPVRLAMLASVEVGRTTETQFTTRWGNPTQKVREGAEVEYVYRNMVDPGSRRPIQYGRSDAWVIVTFRYGLAIGARSSDTERCRASFPPRPPGFGFSNPTTVVPVGDCAEWLAMARASEAMDGGSGHGGAGHVPGSGVPGGSGGGSGFDRPGVAADIYAPDGSGK
jgi:uncharacterized membrane protein YgcG